MPQNAWPAQNPELWAIDRLKLNENNTRTHTDEQIAQIAASIREFGFTIPILVDEDGRILAGEGRWRAARDLLLAEVPVIIAKGWTDEQKTAYAIADNKIALNAGWDFEKLGVQLSELEAAGFDALLTGFDQEEIDELTATKTEGETDPDEIPAPPLNPFSRLGDVWICGRHRVVCGDSTNTTDVEKALAGVTPALMVTDPPYGVEYDPNWRNNAKIKGRKIGATATGKVRNDERADWREAWALFGGEVAYVWCASLHSAEAAESLQAASFEMRAQIIWVKHTPVIGRGHYHWQHEPCWYAVRKGKTASWAGDRKQSTVWEITHKASDTGHGTQKPVECMRRPIVNNSSPGQAVYDPFLGSGTTLIAAEMEGRSCHGLEIAPEYVDVIVRRWEEFTGEKAVREADGAAFGGYDDEGAKAEADAPKGRRGKPRKAAA